MLWAALVALLSVTANAQDTSGPTAELPDSRTLAVQDKVDELFESGKFERAYFIYRNELAPVGDKYAQYMVGYMHLMGMGVEEDEVEASSWYRLAAERGYPQFVAVRKQVLESLDNEELEQSDQRYLDLRKRFSDVALMMSLLHRDVDELTSRVTGSRLSGRGGAVTIVNPRSGVGLSGDSYFREIEIRMRQRLDYVTKTLGIDPLTPDLDNRALRDLQERVDRYLLVVNDR